MTFCRRYFIIIVMIYKIYIATHARIRACGFVHITQNENSVLTAKVHIYSCDASASPRSATKPRVPQALRTNGLCTIFRQKFEKNGPTVSEHNARKNRNVRR